MRRGQITPADRVHLRAWLARFVGRDDVAFALEACTGWRYVAGELAAAGVAAHLAEPADTAFACGRKRHAKADKTGGPSWVPFITRRPASECWPSTEVRTAGKNVGPDCHTATDGWQGGSGG